MLSLLREKISYFFFKRRLRRKMDALYVMEDPWRSANLRAAFEPFIKEALRLRSQESASAPVLDAGGGEGWYREALDSTQEYHLLDLSRAALERAQKRIPNSRARFIPASLDGFKPQRNLYGTVLLISVLNYLGRDRHPRIYRSILNRLGDALLPGGVILVIHPFYTPEEQSRVQELSAPFLERPDFRKVRFQIREGKPQSFLCEIYQKIAK